MLEAASHPKITLFAYSEVIGVSGHVGEFNVKIKRKARFIDEQKCTGCGACSPVCPVVVPNEFNCGLDTRKAIYALFAQAVPLKYTIDGDKCIRCGLCVRECNENAIDFNQKDEIIEIDVGTIIVATGIKIFDPTGEYGYGQFENVITQLQLERILAPNGPTFGELRRISDENPPTRVLMIQCVGSRSIKTNPYCSAGVCCLVALKNAALLKQHDPNTEVTICYIDMRTPGKEYEEYFRRARLQGIRFIRGNFARIEENQYTKNLLVRIEDTLMNKYRRVEADLVVLSVAMEPSEGTISVANLLRLERSPDGFIKEFHSRLDPIGTKVPGIYLAGTAQGPHSVADTVAMSKGAASSAAIPMSAGLFEIELVRAIVDLEKCSRCGNCIEVCPYNAISLLENKIEVDEITCRGCGACASVCKNNAMTLRSYRNKQIEAYLDGLIKEVKQG